MYHKKNVDYAYLMWEDFVYQVKNKNIKKSNEMYYPRFTKVVSGHEDTHLYGAILPNELTNEDIRNSESYKEYYAVASGAEPPKTKASKRLKTSAKAAKPAKKKQPAKTSKAKGQTVLSEIALTEAEQMKLTIKRSLIETHGSHASGSGVDEGTGSIPDIRSKQSELQRSSTRGIKASWLVISRITRWCFIGEFMKEKEFDLCAVSSSDGDLLSSIIIKSWYRYGYCPVTFAKGSRTLFNTVAYSWFGILVVSLDPLVVVIVDIGLR
ncbi:hypothetical protein Tco_0825875 [Tanacetum coccineum]